MKTGFIDRFMCSLPQPVPVADYAPAPVEFGPRIWTIDRRLRMPGGLILPVCSTVLRVKEGSVVVISPPLLDPQLVTSLQGLGGLAGVIAPNSFHYVFLDHFKAAFPEAQAFVPPRMQERVAPLADATTLSETSPPIWAEDMEQRVFGPIGNVAEMVFFHKASTTLILTDLAFNMIHFESTLQRCAWRIFGVPSSFGPSRLVRLTLLSDTAKSREYLAPILQWPFERIIVAHGSPVLSNARAEFRRTYAPYL
jgi:hypothetical protein